MDASEQGKGKGKGKGKVEGESILTEEISPGRSISYCSTPCKDAHESKKEVLKKIKGLV